MNDEFGDFQTPGDLAHQVCKLLADNGLVAKSIVEPTCGVGSFLLAAFDQFPAASIGLGFEINADYLRRLGDSLKGRPFEAKVRLVEEDFFQADWASCFRDLPEPILVIGNPPWVTSAHVGALGGTNLPKKSNFQNYVGLDALTGKSNFDISEWMLIKIFDSLRGRQATLAVLCKTAVARKVLAHAWKDDRGLAYAEIRTIDAAAHFGAAVDACLLVCSLNSTRQSKDCRVYTGLDNEKPESVIGYHDGQMVADVTAYERWKHLSGEGVYKWRSGVKHDCSKVMELRADGGRYRNGLGELADLEDDYLYPMLKSSELANGRTTAPTRLMLITQKAVGDDTNPIRLRAPKTWEYLQLHGDHLGRRASSIYRNRPRFSVFGVGDYTFSPWKVAISGFYKRLGFAVVGNLDGKPIVLDDTAYFLPCQSKEEATLVASLLNSEPALGFFSSFIFWDSKRPITVELLRRVDLAALARELDREAELERFLHPNPSGHQLELFGSG